MSDPRPSLPTIDGTVKGFLGGAATGILGACIVVILHSENETLSGLILAVLKLGFFWGGIGAFAGAFAGVIMWNKKFGPKRTLLRWAGIFISSALGISLITLLGLWKLGLFGLIG